MADSSPIDPDRLHAILQFIQAAEALKDTLRSGHTAQGRSESVAEHTWRLCLLVLMFDKELRDYDLLKILKLCIVHDLGEAISGDVPAIHQSQGDDREAREREDLHQLCQPLPADLRDEITSLWDEYTNAASPEAIMVKGFDKLETMLQHLAGRNAPDFDYAFNLDYGTRQTGRHPLLQQIRDVVDAETRTRCQPS